MREVKQSFGTQMFSELVSAAEDNGNAITLASGKIFALPKQPRSNTSFSKVGLEDRFHPRARFIRST